DVPAALADGVARRSDRQREEEHAAHVRRQEAADPGTDDCRRTGDRRERRQASDAHACPRGDRRRDPETFGQVVHHEADDQEGAERDLSERDRGPDREPLSEVVKSNPGRDHAGEREPLERYVPFSVAACREALSEQCQAEIADRDAEQDQTRPLEAARQRRLQLERLCKRIEREERQQPGRQGHEGTEPVCIGTAQRRQPGEPERNRDDADEQADQCVAEEPARRGGAALDRRSHIAARLDAMRAGDADAVGITLDPVERNHYRARAQPRQRRLPLDAERDDGAAAVARRDRQLRALWVRDPNPDLARLELDPPDLKLIERWRRATDQVEQRTARRGEQRDDPGQNDDRQQRPEAPRPRAEATVHGTRAGLHQSTTSKKPIQPSSVNSGWWAWNMNCPVLWKSISMIPRCPWQSITVSVYS